LNFAAVQRVPLVVIAEYNRWAYSTPPEKQFAVRDLAEKAKAYGVPGVTVDGNDVLAVYEATRFAVERARGGHGVHVIEVKTYRRGLRGTGTGISDGRRHVPRSAAPGVVGGDGARSQRVHPGGGRGGVRRRVQGDRRIREAVRRGARDRHADLGSGDRRRGGG